MRPTVAILVILGIAVLACARPADEPALALDKPAEEPGDDTDGNLSGAWTLVELPRGTTVPDGIEVTIEFEGNQVSGSSGCNSYSGTMEHRGTGTLEPGLMSATQKFCEGDVMEVEKAYLRALGSASTYSVENDTLEIGYGKEDDDGSAMVFVRAE